MLKDHSLPPLYAQLEEILINQIKANVFPPGSMLPSERKLSEKYQISRITVRKTLKLLETSGYIKQSRGKRSVVITDDPSAQLRNLKNSQFVGILDELEELGIPSYSTVLEYGFIPASNVLREALKLGSSESTIFLYSRVYADHTSPILYNTSYTKDETGQLIKDIFSPRANIIRYLTTHGYKIAYSEYNVQVTTATIMDHKILHIPHNAPIMLIERTVYSYDAQPVIWSRTFCRPDRYSFHVTLKK